MLANTVMPVHADKRTRIDGDSRFGVDIHDLACDAVGVQPARITMRGMAHRSAMTRLSASSAAL